MLVGVASCVVTPVLSVWASIQIADNNRERAERQAEQVAVEVRVETTERYCRLFGSQVDVYKDATTPVGRDAYRTWLAEYNRMQCQPPK